MCTPVRSSVTARYGQMPLAEIATEGALPERCDRGFWFRPGMNGNRECPGRQRREEAAMKALLLIALAVAVVGIAQGATRATSVKATEVEFHVKLSTTSAKSGRTSFVVKNSGHLAHQFLVLKTSLAANKLPLRGTTVNIAKAGKLIGGIAGVGLKAGATKTLTLTLPAGHYVLFCNLPAHYKSGQYASFIVH